MLESHRVWNNHNPNNRIKGCGTGDWKHTGDRVTLLVSAKMYIEKRYR